MKLPLDWYQRPDTLQISRELLGKFLVVNNGSKVNAGMIVETEAYVGREDRACHSFGGRKTTRTEIMYKTGGLSYVYICYGIHHLFNVITNVEDEPHAVLVRALEPAEGLSDMLDRRSLKVPDYRITKGPGSLSKALGITKSDNGLKLDGDRVWIEDRGIEVKKNQFDSGPRVGVAGAGPEAAGKPWRFWVVDNPYVSRFSP